MFMSCKVMEQKSDRMESLRKKAEGRLQRQMPEIEDLTAAEIRNLIHDYHVHQIELEIQNEELRDAHEQLQKARDRMAILFNQAPVGYLQVDHCAIVRQANQTFADMVGCKPEHVSGKPLADFLIPEDRDAFRGRFRAFFKNPQDKHLDFGLQASRGLLTVRFTGRKELEEHPCPGKDDIQNLLLAVSDITKQVQSRQALMESEERFRKLIENMAEGIVLKDASDHYVHWNQAASDIFGLDLDKFKGRTTESFSRKIIREDGSHFPAHELPSLHSL
ncbi:MAG: PAS domain-containing protein, partial [Desulfonatronovibrio sp.]